MALCGHFQKTKDLAPLEKGGDKSRSAPYHSTPLVPRGNDWPNLKYLPPRNALIPNITLPSGSFFTPTAASSDCAASAELRPRSPVHIGFNAIDRVSAEIEWSG